jgi:hypothetical protein
MVGRALFGAPNAVVIAEGWLRAGRLLPTIDQGLYPWRPPILCELSFGYYPRTSCRKLDN